MEEAVKTKDPAAVSLGSRGGKKTAQRGSEFFREISRIGKVKRALNKQKKQLGGIAR